MRFIGAHLKKIIIEFPLKKLPPSFVTCVFTLYRIIIMIYKYKINLLDNQKNKK